MSWLRRCVEANRTYPIAHFHLAAALALCGEVDEAQAVVRTALEHDHAPELPLEEHGASSVGDVRSRAKADLVAALLEVRE